MISTSKNKRALLGPVGSWTSSSFPFSGSVSSRFLVPFLIVPVITTFGALGELDGGLKSILSAELKLHTKSHITITWTLWDQLIGIILSFMVKGCLMPNELLISKNVLSLSSRFAKVPILIFLTKNLSFFLEGKGGQNDFF